MPMLVPLAASAFSISAGLSAGGLLGGMMVAGGALGGLGALTGNKKLMTLGSVLGLAGGLGTAMGLGNAAGEATKTAVTDAAGRAASEAASATAGNTIADATGAAASTAATEAARTAAAGTDLGLFNNLGADAGSSVAASGGQQGGGLVASQIASTPADLALAAGTKAANTAPSFWESLGNSFDPRAAGDAMTGVKNAAGALWDGATSAVKGVGQWAEANPNTAKLASGLVGGAMNYVGQTQAQKDALALKAKHEGWARQRYNDSLANLRIPGPMSTLPGSSGIIAASRG